MVWQKLWKSVVAITSLSRYVPLCPAPAVCRHSLRRWQQDIVFRVRKARFVQDGWENRMKELALWMRSGDICCGCLFTQWGSGKTEPFSFISWLYWFICSINTLKPHSPFFIMLFSCFHSSFLLVMKVGPRIKMQHIHKETLCNLFWGLWNPHSTFNKWLYISDVSKAWSIFQIDHVKA